MMIDPVSVSPPAIVVMVPVAVESVGILFPMAATLCCNTASACGSIAGGLLVVGVCARVITGVKINMSTRGEGNTRHFMARSKRAVTTTSATRRHTTAQLSKVGTGERFRYKSGKFHPVRQRNL